MWKKFKTWQILLALAILVGVVLVIIYWTEISTKFGIARQISTSRTATAGLSSTSRSKGCTCVKGYLTNYGLGSSIPCSSWSRYCEGTASV